MVREGIYSRAGLRDQVLALHCVRAALLDAPPWAKRDRFRRRFAYEGQEDFEVNGHIRPHRKGSPAGPPLVWLVEQLHRRNLAVSGFFVYARIVCAPAAVHT